jgi:hypothetical protein
MRPIFVASASFLAALALGGPALAQDAPEPKVNQLIIYGDDKCPVADGEDTITVCARKAEAERYRIPSALRESASPQNEAWTNRVMAYERVGAGGWTGCSGKLIEAAYAEKKGAPDVKFSELIAEERARRLSTLDKDAAETQARVEALEKEIEARQKAQAEEAAKQEAPQPN